nr:proteoglycan 4-like [Aegilops tauschii subsp. strangulata]
MQGDQLVPAVVAAVAVVCLLIAGRVDGQDEYVPAGAASKEVEPLATNQNPGQILPQPEVMPVPSNLLPRPGASRPFTGGKSPQQPTTEPEPETEAEPQPEPETEAEPQPEQTTTREPEPVTPTRDQGDFYRTGATPTTPEPPATPTTPETWETPATPSVPVQQGYP